MKASLQSNHEIKKMVAAIEKAGCFNVEKDMESGTIKAKHGETLVFAALRKGENGQPWITRIHEKLFV